MKLKRYLLPIVLMLLIQTQVHSQEKRLNLTLNYAAGIPMGNFKTITNKTSLRGWDASLLYVVNSKLSLGLQTGFQDFYQKYPRQVLHSAGSDLSAVVINSVQVSPIMAKVKYRFTNSSFIEPFVALAAGGNLISYRKYYGEFPDNKSAFGFAAQPELGLFIPLSAGKQTGFNLSAGYNMMPFKYNDVNGLNNIVLKGGLSFYLR